MPIPRIVNSFNYAIEGLIYVLRTERNMRLHVLFAIFILLTGIYLNLTGVELLILLVAILFVLFAEMINTAIEFTVDLVSTKVHPLARIIKDVSAGAVLLAAVNAAVVGYVIFAKYIGMPLENTAEKIRQSPWHITFISLIIVLGVVILGKVILHRGTPFRGGMPSGHAALAFSLWTAVVFTTPNQFVVILTFILAFLVARSRVSGSIHTPWEAIAGALVGVLTTTTVFQILH